MNERAWILVTQGFVNKVCALFAAFLLTFILAGCSGQDETADQGTDVPNQQASIFAQVIWESQTTPDDLMDLAIGMSSASNAYVLGLDESGNAYGYDMDGALAMQSTDARFSAISNGAPFTIDGVDFAAFPALDETGNLVIALASPELGVVGVAPVTLPAGMTSSFDRLCGDGTSFVAIGEAGPTFAAELVLGDDGFVAEALDAAAPSLTQATCESLPQGAETTKAAQFEDNVLALTVFETGQTSISLTGQDEEPYQDSQSLGFNPGMTVGAPAIVTALAIASGRLSQDYETGLIAVAGSYADGRPRIAYIAAGPLLEQLQAPSEGQ